MTTVLIAPIGLDERCWEPSGLLAGDAVAHLLPGFGGRPRATPPATMAQLADEVAAAHAGPLDVVGVSMGAMVGQNLAVRHPDRVRSLLMACTGPSVDPAAMEQRARAVEQGGWDAVLDSTLERWFTAPALRQDPPHRGVAYARATLLALAPAAFADGWRSIASHDVRDDLARVRARVTCLAGRQDASAPVERVRHVADGIPGARLVELDGPHMLHLERPDAFADAVRAHLQDAAS